jgi:hypothetical protein
VAVAVLIFHSNRGSDTAGLYRQVCERLHSPRSSALTKMRNPMNSGAIALWGSAFLRTEHDRTAFCVRPDVAPRRPGEGAR